MACLLLSRGETLHSRNIMSSRPILTSLAIAASLACGNPRSAAATTLIQTNTNTQTISLPDPSTGAIVPDSFFTVTFDPFVGDGLTDAVFAVTETFSGSLTVGGQGGSGGGVGFGGKYLLNGDTVTGLGGGDGNGGGPNLTFPLSAAATASQDILYQFTQLIGTGPLDFTEVPDAATAVFTGSFTPGVAELDGTVTVTETLTYTFHGNGALVAPIPEPGSLTLIATGLFALCALRRQRAHNPPATGT
jgi:hypothetical protein